MALPEAATPNRPVALIAPPSTLMLAPEAKPIELPVEVPMLKVPSDILNNPVRVGEPFCPTTVAFELFIQNPPVEGIEYAATLNTGLLNVLEPESLNVPFVIVRKPTVLAP